MVTQNKAIAIAKRNELYSLIKTVGQAWDEPIEDLRSYAKFVALEWENEIDKAIECFKDLKQQAIDLNLIKKEDTKKPQNKNFEPYLGKTAMLYRK